MLFRRNTLFFAGSLAGASLMLLACSAQEEQKPIVTNSHDQGVKKQTTVVIPPFSLGKWRAVVIGITDKKTGKVIDSQIPIGVQSTVSGTDLSILVENFLPQFIMQGTVLTTQSNETKNPAAQIKVFSSGHEIFKGWLFALYPNTHAFDHPNYGFTLKGFIPTK